MRKLVSTVNEIRAEEGKQALPGPLGDAPVNQSLINPWMVINGIGQQQPGEGGEGGQGEEGGEARTVKGKPIRLRKTTTCRATT